MQATASEFSRRRSVRVTFSNGATIETEINGTPESIRRYYSSGPFQFGDTDENPRDELASAINVEFLD
jgi:hypothetical protein